MNSFARPRTWPRRRVVVVGAAICLVLAAVGLGMTIQILGASESPPTSQGSTETAVPHEAEPEPEPARAHVPATFSSWVDSGGRNEESALFSAEVGSSPGGKIALLINGKSAPGAESRGSLKQVVLVEPETEYNFSIKFDSSGQEDPESGVSIQLGDAGKYRMDLPQSTDGWTSASMAYTTGPGETELAVEILPTGTVGDFLLRDVSLTAGGSSGERVENGSFVDFTAPAQITNSTLILDKGSATIGVSKRSSSIIWAVANDQGGPVSNGSLDLQSGLGIIPLSTLDQGMYSIELEGLSDANGKVKFSFLILDEVHVPSGLDTRFGIGFHASRAYNEGVVGSIVDLGFGSARTPTNWGPTEITPGKYDFPAIQDDAIQKLEASGVEILAISGNGNNLYDGGQAPSSPGALVAFSNYGQALVEHYEPSAVEIYNEFNWITNKSACGATAECYMELLRPSAEKIRASRPATKIVGPANALLDNEFMTALYNAGGLELLDAVSFHPYDLGLEGPESMIPTLQQANETIEAHNGGVSKPIWLTELGWTASQVSEADQANYIVRAQAIAFAHGVERYFWYDLVNDTLDPSDGEGNFGLLRQKSKTVPAFEPKPAAMTQAILARKISNKEFVRDESLDKSVYSYVFGSGDDATRIVWATESAEIRFATAKPLNVTTAYGKETTVKPIEGFVTLSLGGEPLYVEGAQNPATIAPAP